MTTTEIMDAVLDFQKLPKNTLDCLKYTVLEKLMFNTPTRRIELCGVLVGNAAWKALEEDMLRDTTDPIPPRVVVIHTILGAIECSSSNLVKQDGIKFLYNNYIIEKD